jgi:hypothetical protein
MVRQALVATINPDQEKVFIRQAFAHIGHPLDGEYWLPGFRLAPGSLQHPFVAERVLHIDQTVTALDWWRAHAIGALQAKRIAALLSVFLGVGLYQIPSYHQWVIEPHEDGSVVSRCLQRGYIDPAPALKEMPRKGEQPLGKPYPVDRSAPRIEVHDNMLRCPADIRHLLRSFNAPPSPEKDAYQQAAALHQVALVKGADLPSLAVAYQVAAVDALSRTTTDSRAAFVATVQAAVPTVTEDSANWLYGAARSAHVHAGEFPLGEFLPQDIGSIGGREQLALMNIRMQSHPILRYTLIKWLLDRGSGSVTASAASSPSSGT